VPIRRRLDGVTELLGDSPNDLGLAEISNEHPFCVRSKKAVKVRSPNFGESSSGTNISPNVPVSQLVVAA